jgi:hypothetical protein
MWPWAFQPRGVLHAFANFGEFNAFANGQALLAQYRVMGMPGTYSMTKYGWPSEVLPASKTLAIAG